MRTLLDDACDPSLIELGEVVMALDADAPNVTEVGDMVDKASPNIVHVHGLPDAFEDYEALVRRTLHHA